MSLAVPSAHNHLTEDAVSATARMPPMEPYRYRNSVSQVLGARHGTKGCTCIRSFYLHGSSARWCCCSHTPQMQAWGHKGRSDFLGFTQLVSFLPHPLAPWSRTLVLSEGAGNARALTNPEPVNRCEL